MATAAISREWKKGNAELLLLSLIEVVPRHGYEIGKLIEQLSWRMNYDPSSGRTYRSR